MIKSPILPRTQSIGLWKFSPFPQFLTLSFYEVVAPIVVVTLYIWFVDYFHFTFHHMLGQTSVSTFLPSGFMGTNSPRDYKHLWQQPLRMQRPLQGGGQELLPVSSSFMLWNVFQSRSPSTAHRYLDLHHDFAMLGFEIQRFLLWDSFPFPPSVLLPDSDLQGPTFSSHQPHLPFWARAELLHRGPSLSPWDLPPSAPRDHHWLRFSSQTAELHSSMSCSCMSWSHHRCTLTWAGPSCWVIRPGPVSRRLHAAWWEFQNFSLIFSLGSCSGQANRISPSWGTWRHVGKCPQVCFLCLRFSLYL